MNYTIITLGELLTQNNETIKRNAMSILKTLQKGIECPVCDKKMQNGTCRECDTMVEKL